jgi:hypothetical protein
LNSKSRLLLLKQDAETGLIVSLNYKTLLLLPLEAEVAEAVEGEGGDVPLVLLAPYTDPLWLLVLP